MLANTAINGARGRAHFFLALLACGCADSALAQNDFFNSLEIDIDSSESRSNESYSLIGWVTQKVSQGIERPGPLFTRQDRDLNKIETSLFAQLDTKLGAGFDFRLSGKVYHDEVYRLNEGIDYSSDETNEFRNRFEVRDFYIEKQYDNGIYLKLGNQILAWGLAEYIRVTDLINTEDQYTFAQQDLEDIRLQVPAALLSYSTDDWTLDGVVTYRANKNYTAPIGDEFDQFAALRQAGIRIERGEIEREAEYFFRASTHLSQGDLQFVAGEFNNNALSLEEITALRSTNPRFQYGQNRMRAFGVAANWADGSWLYFGEIGLHMDKAVIPKADSIFRQVNGWDEKDQVLSVLGVEYNGFRNLLLTFELDSIRTKNHDDFMYADKNQTSFGARLYWTALNEKLSVVAVRNELANQSGQVSRVSIDYDWSDSIEVGLLWVDYGSDRDSIFYNYRNNDIVQAHLRYNFQI
ncbi:MAG: hypothetical protein DHS20C12_17640 [Pseudohongiella sp.]|nr:MAG: hypothetical protein DHS20C12_17640 [Pseudohongiella sp.]